MVEFDYSSNIAEPANRSFQTKLKMDSKRSGSILSMDVCSEFPNLKSRLAIEPPLAQDPSAAQNQRYFQQNDPQILPISATIEEVRTPERPVRPNVCDILLDSLYCSHIHVYPGRLQALRRDRLY